MDNVTFKTDRGVVIAKVTKGGVELHIPSNFNGKRLEEFKNLYESELLKLRPKMPVGLVGACYHAFVASEEAGEDGLTYNPWSKSTPKTGYAVGLTHNKVGETIVGSPGIIRTFLRKHSLKLRISGMYMGSWKDPKTGIIYLDLVKVLKDREDAVTLGRELKQVCIYHIDEADVIYLEEEPFTIEI